VIGPLKERCTFFPITDGRIEMPAMRRLLIVESLLGFMFLAHVAHLLCMWLSYIYSHLQYRVTLDRIESELPPTRLAATSEIYMVSEH
jgi:hypothetical protein